MSEITKELERRIEAGWMVEPQDVRRMLKHNDDMGRSFFAVAICLHGYVTASGNSLSALSALPGR